MQVLGHINGIAHHERNRPTPIIEYPTMTAEGRRKIIATLASHPDWTTRSIAEALAVSEAVVTADLNEIGIDYPTPPTQPVTVAVPATESHRDRQGRFITDSTSSNSPLLQAYRNAPHGLTTPEAATITGIEHNAAAKRISRLRKRGLLTHLTNENGTVRRSNHTVYTTTETPQ